MKINKTTNHVVKKARQRAKPKLEALTLSCVGMKYRMSAEDLSRLTEAVPIDCNFELEPTNEHDKDAIKVLDISHTKPEHIGYVARPSNKFLRELLRRGAIVKDCILTEVEEDRGWGNLELQLLVPRKR